MHIFYMHTNWIPIARIDDKELTISYEPMNKFQPLETLFTDRTKVKAW
jgi:hypothetical protein